MQLKVRTGGIAGVSARVHRGVGLVAIAVLSVSCLLTCADPLDLCTPKKARLDFFSMGDCALTRTSFFQGHEWLTYFGNEDLSTEDRFTRSELQAIVEGNRRVDWPKELLFHMNNGVLAYIAAVGEHAERPEHQRLHFLLTERNTSAEAAADARGEVRRLSREAITRWQTDRVRALTQVGQAVHIIQDGYSKAHTVRDAFHTERQFCILKVKAYIERAPGFDTPDIEYHTDDGDGSVGHTTSQDSIYRNGRDCHDPATRAQVEECLSEVAQLGRTATRDYLALMQRVSRVVSAGTSTLDDALDKELPAFFLEHMELCP